MTLDPLLDLPSELQVLGDRARACMVAALMDGRARTATELALCAEVAPSTASVHLQRLLDGGWLQRIVAGRHRYFGLAAGAAERVEGVEGVLVLRSTPPPNGARRLGPADPALRQARVCYDHLAGELGVLLARSLVAAGHLQLHWEGAALSRSGYDWLAELGIQPDTPHSARTPIKACMDWSERVPHLGGGVATALLNWMLARRMLQRTEQSRVLWVSPRARRFVQDLA